jgi:5-methylcytosine-specific restriction endonuclease McrA
MISLCGLGIAFSGFSRAQAADEENCLMCHKYPYLARIGDNGLVENYNVNEHIFLNSLHGKVGCRDCHTYIKKFPHDPVTEKVNCGNVCHIRPPFTDEYFSHRKIIGVFGTSIHAVKPDDSPLMKESDPDCKYCHLNPLYQRVDENVISYGKTLDRCLNCHQRKGVTEAYRHIMHRLRHKTSRSSQQIVALCAGCHGNVPLMKKLGFTGRALDAVQTYKESIHGKMTTLGSERAADCISCHASSLIHDIYKKDNPRATINEKNLQSLCKNCHAKINKYFVQIAVHPSIEAPSNPILFILSNLVLRGMLYGTIFGLMGLLFLETFRRKKDGASMKLKSGSTWRKKKK